MTHIETQQAKTPSHHLFLVEKKEKYLKKIFSNDLIYYIEDLLGVSFFMERIGPMKASSANMANKTNKQVSL